MKIITSKKFVQSQNMQNSIKNKIRGEIAKIGPYSSSLMTAVKQADSILKTYGFYLANEDGSPFEGIFTGESGKTELNIASQNNNLLGDTILFQWHKMPSGSQYDINMYMN